MKTVLQFSIEQPVKIEVFPDDSGFGWRYEVEYTDGDTNSDRLRNINTECSPAEALAFVCAQYGIEPRPDEVYTAYGAFADEDYGVWER